MKMDRNLSPEGKLQSIFLIKCFGRKEVLVTLLLVSPLLKKKSFEVAGSMLLQALTESYLIHSYCFMYLVSEIGRMSSLI